MRRRIFLRAKVVSQKKMCIFAILFRLLPRGRHRKKHTNNEAYNTYTDCDHGNALRSNPGPGPILSRSGILYGRRICPGGGAGPLALAHGLGADGGQQVSGYSLPLGRQSPRRVRLCRFRKICLFQVRSVVGARRTAAVQARLAGEA